jgi:putative flavoprotein involved in K+ transport
VPNVTDQTVVVGAGPAGLAVAAMLAEHGAAYTVLERAGSVGSSWRGRYDSLHLHTARRLSALPGAPIPRGYGRWVGRDDLVAYLDDYASRFHVEPEFGVEVERIDRDPAGWRVETSTGTRLARTVVIATGYGRTPHVPDWPGLPTFPGSFCHSSTYREPSVYGRKNVLVIGAGNSAAEIAVELAGAGSTVQLSVRTPPNIVRRDVLGVPSQVIGVALRRVPESLMNPMIGLLRRLTVPDLREFGLPAPPGDGFTQFLRSRTVPILDHGFVTAIRTGRITVVPAVESVDEPDVHLAGGRIVRPDAMIAATGYRPDLGPLVGELEVLDPSGAPRVHGAQTATGAPGLYFVGIDVELSGLLREIAREAGDVARKVTADALV